MDSTKLSDLNLFSDSILCYKSTVDQAYLFDPSQESSPAVAADEFSFLEPPTDDPSAMVPMEGIDRHSGARKGVR